MWRCSKRGRRDLVSWPEIAAELLEVGSAVAVWERHAPVPALIDLPGDVTPESAAVDVRSWQAAVKISGETEYPWAYVNSWADPATVLASSAADAISDPHVRAGRPIVIDAAAIVDWAVWGDWQGIIEGGATNSLALRGDKNR